MAEAEAPMSSPEDSGLRDKVVVVTGGGNGLGRACALELAARGAAVVVNDPGGNPDGTGGSQSAADAVVAEIRAADGIAVASYSSVATQEGADSIIETAVTQLGGVDGLAHYAGIIRMQRFEMMPVADFDAVVEVHLRGAFLVSQAAFRAMRDRGSGSILYVGSSAGLFGEPASANYCAAKAGMYGLMRCVSLEGAAHGIRANYLMPGAMTRLGDEAVNRMNRLGSSGSAVEATDPAEARSSLAAVVGAAVDPAFGTAVATLLLSSDCELTGRALSAMLGNFAEAFVGCTRGWAATEVGRQPNADDVARLWTQITDRDGYVTPGSAAEDVARAIGLLG
jgi:NAD(P)-dependent dehydrogenase (short-subunit alcohol dehydrogenase family)